MRYQQSAVSSLWVTLAAGSAPRSCMARNLGTGTQRRRRGKQTSQDGFNISLRLCADIQSWGSLCLICFDWDVIKVHHGVSSHHPFLNEAALSSIRVPEAPSPPWHLHNGILASRCLLPLLGFISALLTRQVLLSWHWLSVVKLYSTFTVSQIP